MSEADEAFDATLDEELEDYRGTPDVLLGDFDDISEVPPHPKGWEIRDTYENPYCHGCHADPCICSEAESRAAGNQLVGKIITTNYGTGPYRITEVAGPCRCPNYIDSLEQTWIYQAPRTEVHWHITMRKHPKPEHEADHDYYLGQYRLDGTSVNSADRFEIIGDTGNQLELDL